MKLAKSLLLGAAAGLVSVASASAADLPSRTKGPAVEYVKVCDVAGVAGFYIPGSDTCLKISGQVRAEYRFGNQGKTFTTTDAANGNLVPAGTTNAAGVLGLNDTNNITATRRSKDMSVWFSRASIRLDARTQTAYGVLRSFGAIDFNTTNNAGGLGIDKAFIQWAGITAGYAQSNFDFYADDAGYSGVRTSDSTVNMLAYTATFGGGFAATVSLEDPRSRQYGIVNLGGANAIRAGYAGTRYPNIVGAIGIYNQTWGAAQLSAVAHQLVTQNQSNIASTTRGTSNFGYAVQAGVKINLPFLGAKDAFFLQGAYSQGATAYALEGAGSTAAGNSAGGFPGGITQVHGDAVALPCTTLGCTGYRLDKEKAYSVVAALEHYWTPTIRQDIYGSYARVTPGSASKAGDWRLGYLGNWTEYRVATTLYWMPVAGLQIGVDGIYARVNQSLARAPGFLASSTTIQTGGVVTNFKKDYDSFSGRLRINRSF